MSQRIVEISATPYNPDRTAPNAYQVRVMGEYTGSIGWCSQQDMVSTTIEMIKKVKEES